MKALILAAGYATRLFPLTKDFPKPLLRVGDRTILDHLLDQIEGIDLIDRTVVVTNHRFFRAFEDWRDGRGCRKPVQILDDGTASNEDRLGAVGDLQFALEHATLEDDLLVAAADNLLCFPLTDLVGAFLARRAPHLCVHHVEDLQRLRRTGVAVLGAEDRVLGFTEKPQEPPSAWAVPPLYVFPRESLRKIGDYLAAGGSSESPGNLIEWLHRSEPVFACRIRGSILDIGTPESLESARRFFSGGAP